MRTLKIDKNCVYKIKIEKLDEFEDSFFADVYCKATKCLIDIIDSNNNNNNNNNKEDDFNNIISFVGERGTGKTSAMISFKNSLQQLYDITELSENRELKKNYVNITEYKFYCLDTIDPSIFNDKDSIIEIVVAEMFKKFKDERKKQDYIKKQELVKKFEIVYKDLRALNKNKHTMFNENLDNLEVLMDLSSAIALKNDMVKLVNFYLEYMQEDKKYVTKNFLTITIDDLDMNIAAGEKMIEDIRKYLIIPKVIIIIAVKFEQLEEVIKQKNITDLNGLCNYYRNTDELIKNSKQEYMTKSLDDELDNKTNKYLEKVIPYNKRIYMPDVCDSDAKIEVDLDKFDYKGNDSIEIFIAEKFYQYFKYTIVTKSHYNVIIPNNLRGLVDLILFLSTLEEMEFDESDEIKNKKSIINNLTAMREYFDKIIVHKISNLYMIVFLKELLQCPIESINKKILLYLNTNLYLLKASVDNGISKYLIELHRMERRVVDESVTLGDVVTWMKLYEDMAFSSEEKIFIELLKAVYSIRLINEIYVGSEELVYIIGKDIVGKYFEFTGNKHDQKIELNVKIEGGEIYRNTLNKKSTSMQHKIVPVEWVKFSRINKSYYSLLEPQYRNEDRYILPKLYRDMSNTVKEIINSNSTLFYFKPFNILGVNDEVYEDIYNKTNPSIDKEILSASNREPTNYLSINNYILFLNMDFYMLALKHIDKVLDKSRLENSYNPKIIIDTIYDVSNRVFSKLCNECNYINISNSIKNIFESKKYDFNLDFNMDNSITKNENSIESSQQIVVEKSLETDTNLEMYKRLNQLKKYLTKLQKHYDKADGTKIDVFKRLEITIKRNYIAKITDLNNKIFELNVKDVNNLFENILSILDISEQKIDLEKEKIMVNNIIEGSIKGIDSLLKKMKLDDVIWTY
ncbi:hypothetical protein [Clostridium estertheticum]|uniref:hypothetical protein n=1 Tax=Clostridium estertheticum TaxID=238834 RepID=UPI001C6F5D08|nr:hypothetical protein [Clostridium estertheticum]MBW9151450.1 hypothetical protein [Clostridium estertheticum]WLC83411.1 hypothetical protein KTC97_15120 [Clostridium estertheticum]